MSYTFPSFRKISTTTFPSCRNHHSSQRRVTFIFNLHSLLFTNLIAPAALLDPLLQGMFFPSYNLAWEDIEKVKKGRSNEENNPPTHMAHFFQDRTCRNFRLFQETPLIKKTIFCLVRQKTGPCDRRWEGINGMTLNSPLPCFRQQTITCAMEGPRENLELLPHCTGEVTVIIRLFCLEAVWKKSEVRVIVSLVLCNVLF